MTTRNYNTSGGTLNVPPHYPLHASVQDTLVANHVQNHIGGQPPGSTYILESAFSSQ